MKMYISRIKIQNFKKFADLELEFARGINVVLGDNEAGKSTLSRAIIEILFTDPTTRSKAFFEEIYPWNGEKNVYLEADLVSDGVTYRLSKDFGKGEAHFINLETEKTLENMAEIDLALERIMGVNSRQIFSATAFVRQADVAAIETTDDFISAIHQVAATTGAKVNVQKIIRDLESELSKLRVGLDRPAKNPGQLKLEQSNIESIVMELSEKKLEWEKVNHASALQKSSFSKLDEINNNIDEINQLLENNRTLKEATKKINDLDLLIVGMEEELKNVRDLSTTRDQVKIELGGYQIFAKENLEEVTRKISQLSESKKLINLELQKFRKERQERKVKKTILVPENLNLTVPAIISLVLLVIGIFTTIIWNWLALVAAGGSALLIFAIYYFTRRGRFKEVVKIENQMTTEYDYLIVQLEEKLKLNAQLFLEILTKFNLADSEEFFTKKAEFLRMLAEYNELDAELKGLLGGRSYDDLNNKQLLLFKEKKEIGTNELTTAVKNSSLNSEEYLRKTRELDNLYLEKKKFEEENISSKVRVSDAHVEYDDILILEEKLEQAEKSLVYLQKKEMIIEITIRNLQEAMEKTAKSANKQVAATVEKYLQNLTAGHYKNARLSSTLAVEVFSDQKNDWIDPIKYLSKGTVDQIYFLCRLAFLKMILREKSVPLILDDPFVTFDSGRKQEIQKILQDYSKNGQVIIFSHDPIYEGWGKLINKLNRIVPTEIVSNEHKSTEMSTNSLPN